MPDNTFSYSLKEDFRKIMFTYGYKNKHKDSDILLYTARFVGSLL